ncbi:MAG: hypothetical protein NTV34_14740, partial [Proteobacteria bacterium]|nr:hypothetical protein [Pseudomonadota bacterium]
MGLKWLHTAFIVLGFSTLTARSGDLDIDVNGARASYNSQKILADSAKSEYDTAYSRFQPYLSALAAAQ